MRLEISADTHVGRVRDENQDFYGFGIDEELFIVADGMGGHSFGREAAISAVAAAICKEGSLEEKCSRSAEATVQTARANEPIEMLTRRLEFIKRTV